MWEVFLLFARIHLPLWEMWAVWRGGFRWRTGWNRSRSWCGCNTVPYAAQLEIWTRDTHGRHLPDRVPPPHSWLI